MKPEQQRIAIAEACGWTVTHWKVNPFDVIATKDGTEYLLKHLPNYLNDLNAMHEAEKVLTKKQLQTYLDILADAPRESMYQTWATSVFSTASQRAEAFLRTIGKWKDAK